MKKPRDIESLAERLSTAAQTPLVSPAPQAPVQQAPAPQEHTPEPPTRKTKPPKQPPVPVYLRMPRELHEKYDAEAVSRTKATGRGVSVQQIILEKLEGAL